MPTFTANIEREDGRKETYTDLVQVFYNRLLKIAILTRENGESIKITGVEKFESYTIKI